MTFQDIFKSSFLENMTSVTLLDMALALVLAFAVGMFIFLIYKKTFAGVMYSSSFGVTLVALTMITTLVILAVTSNVVLSLGMVGACPSSVSAPPSRSPWTSPSCSGPLLRASCWRRASFLWPCSAVCLSACSC